MVLIPHESVVHIMTNDTLTTALQRFEQGQMTRTQAAALLVHLIHHQPQTAQRYTAQINALIDGGHIIQRDGVWHARKAGGRPRKAKDTRQRLTLYIDADTVAALDAHPLARYMSRNDVILFMINGALRKNTD